MAQAGWEVALRYLADPQFRLVLLDEVNIALKKDYLSIEQVLGGHRSAPAAHACGSHGTERSGCAGRAGGLGDRNDFGQASVEAAAHSRASRHRVLTGSMAIDQSRPSGFAPAHPYIGRGAPAGARRDEGAAQREDAPQQEGAPRRDDAAQPDEDAAWQDWQAARQASSHGARMALQRVIRGGGSGPRFAVGLGYGETLRWFAPIDGPGERRLIIEYAAAVLDADGFPAAPAALAGLACAAAMSGEAAVPGEPAARESAVQEPGAAPLAGLVLLSHAETDLLALERARAELPPDFPAVAGHSLLGLPDSDALLALFGKSRSSQLLAIVRVHGVSSVPGLADLVRLAHEEGWGLVVISGVGGSVDMLPRTSNIAPQFASNLTSYFMAGGVANVAQALRYAAAEHLGFAAGFEAPRAMPAHGLYHPDLLVTSAGEWMSHRAQGNPTAVLLFYRAHVLSGNLQFVDAALRALEGRGFAAVGIFTSSLRDRDAAGIPLALRLLPEFPDIIVNTVSFPVFTLSSPQHATADGHETPFETIGVPLLQAICCGTPRAEWIESARGLSPTEAAMHVALPECDGRMICVPVSFKENHRYVPDLERLSRVAAARSPAGGVAGQIECREADRHRAQQCRRKGAAHRRCGGPGYAGIAAAMAHGHARGRV